MSHPADNFDEMRREPRLATVKFKPLQPSSIAPSGYSTFDKIDGSHPIMEQIPEAVVTYSVRELSGGKVAYFNFELAKEMGLIAEGHTHQLNAALEEKILKTFCLRIINEYDLLTKKQFDPATIKTKKYMATRYLQLQHSNKKGKTSGDGRGIWNGCVTHKGVTWDVSSRGTGVTRLAPGSVQAGKFLRTGAGEFGYGCGLADLDELIGAAVMSDIFHKQGINTERVLCVIDLGKGLGIGVRAAPNLIRPAHLFLHLKQNNLQALRKFTDLFIARQQNNREWPTALRNKEKYNLMLERISSEFARFSARLMSDYIFLWMDWDGDNILASAGIIDYGSIRQFGLRHDQYRYDDVTRFSTSLNEQRAKARNTIQVFAQMVDYLNSGSKKPLNQFENHSALKTFDKVFRDSKLEFFLRKIGLSDEKVKVALRDHRKMASRLFYEFRFFEAQKTHKKLQKVADGVNRPAIFNMRELLRQLPEHYANHTQDFYKGVSHKKFFTMMLSSFAKGRDRQFKQSYVSHIDRFQKLYRNLIARLYRVQDHGKAVKQISAMSGQINHPTRITGNSVTYLVDEMIQHTKNGMHYKMLQRVIDNFVQQQVKALSQYEIEKVLTNKKEIELIQTVLTLVQTHNEDI